MKLFQYRGDMIIFLSSDYKLAAAFCTRCSLSISTAGSPNRILLHESSFDVMKACTMYLSANNADLETLLTWLVILRWESTFFMAGTGFAFASSLS